MDGVKYEKEDIFKYTTNDNNDYINKYNWICCFR